MSFLQFIGKAMIHLIIWRMPRRCLVWLALFGLVLNMACSNSSPSATLQATPPATPHPMAMGISQLAPAATGVTQLAPAATWTSMPSPCIPLFTPQPTQTPGPNAPAPARPPLLQAPPGSPALNGKSQLLDTRWFSAALDREMPLAVYLPPGYFDSIRRYPVLYMLSGFAGDYHEWNNMGLCDALERLIRGGEIQPMIVVLPDGDHSWWFNHAPVAGSDGKAYGDYVWKDLVEFADKNYRTLPQPQSRAVGGLSAGGQGALLFGLTHPDVFAIVGAHSPSIRHADGSLAFFGNQTYFNQYDPLWLFQNVTTWQRLTLWVDVAAEDTQWSTSIHDLHNLLVTLDIPHEWHDDWHGIHDDYYWSAHVSDYMRWYSSHLVGQ